MREDDSLPALSDPGSGGASDDGGGSGLGRGGTGGQRYERQGLLGEGGMGRVYAARDRHLRRQVALKVAARPELAGRLATEAWITAQLEHPGIVAVYDAGEAEGEAWYTMRLIRGRTLRDRLVEHPDTAGRLTLLPHLLAACQAVAYAHAMGIIHRDLKPSNIMVGEFGETQVADWGLARPVDEAREDWARIVSEASLTTSAGTPRYMSPEQARGEPASRASDVFCLGAALYELLSGQPPPAEPGRPPDLATLPADVPQELTAIARRALSLSPEARYPTAVELAADLERWLAGRRVLAHDYRPAELLWRVVKAWRAPLTVGAVALVILGLVAAEAARRNAAERAQAEANYAEALNQQALAALLAERLPEAEVLAAHVLTLGPSPVARGVLAATGQGAAERVYGVDLPEACVHAALVSPDGRRVACIADKRLEVRELPSLALSWSLDAHLLDRPAWLGERLMIGTSEGMQWASAQGLEPAGLHRVDVVAARDGVYAFQGNEAWYLRPGKAPVSFSVCLASGVVVRPLGTHLSVGCHDGVFRTYGPDGAVAYELDLGERPPWSVMEPLGEGVAVGRLDGAVRLLELQDGVLSEPLQGFGGSVRELQPVPGRAVVLARGERGGPRLWDTSVGAWVGSLPAGATSMAAGPEEGTVLLLGERAELWRLPEALVPRTFSFGVGVAQVAVSASGEELGVALGSGEVVRRRTRDGRLLDQRSIGDAVTKAVTFTAAGDLAASVIGGPARVLLPDGGERLLGRGRVLRRLGGLADGRVWGLSYEDEALVFDGATGADLGRTLGTGFFDGSSSADGSAAVLGDETGGVWLLQGHSFERVAEDPELVAVDVGPGGTPLVVARRRALCVDGRCTPLGDDAVDVALSHGLAAVATLTGDVWLLDADSGEILALLRGHQGRVSTVEFGPEAAWLLSGSWDGTVRRWDLSELRTPAEELVARAEARWGLSLQDALRGK